ncbi:MAG TPA: hypothetical protein DCZ94_00700 [Lentisphaeria bacterium]|nr:MAG: hypothetical protein A2X48_12265 [Lentisphaerae bacterium GWF2_49_21]HBC85450.1 hypothetical protein [Lentisphaeria bacterium]
MKKRRVNVLAVAVISAIAIGVLSLMGGCKGREIVLDRPMIPPPSAQDPSREPVVAQPVLLPAPAVKAPAPVAVPATVPK